MEELVRKVRTQMHTSSLIPISEENRKTQLWVHTAATARLGRATEERWLDGQLLWRENWEIEEESGHDWT